MRKRGLVQLAAQAAIELLEDRRLLSSGQLDTSFGAGGQLELPAQGTIYASVAQGDGKVILAGSNLALNQSTTGSFLVERLSASGVPDTTFGTNGVVTTSFAADAKATAVAIESDGKIIVGGGLNLARYNANGTLDTTFGTGGKVTASAASDINIQSLTVTSDEKVVVTGRTTFQDPAHPTDANYAVPAFSVARYSENGTLDTGFNSTGVFIEQLTIDLTNGSTSAPMAVGLQADGKVIVGGNYKIDPAVWRLNLDGTLDITFGRGGMATIPMSYSGLNESYNVASINDLVVQPDGKIVADGFANINDVPSSILMAVRFNADGSPDSTFGDTSLSPGGGAIALPALNTDRPRSPTTLLLQPDGKIIVGGSPGSFEDSIIRLTANGTVDSTFAFTDYSFDNNIGSGSFPTIDLTPDGQILLIDNPQVADSSPGTSKQVTGLIRVQNDYVASTSFPASTKTVNVAAGGINPLFGAHGDVIINDPTTVWAQSSPQRAVRATAVQADGKILIAGSIGTVSTFGIGQIFIERLNADGSTDPTFGTNGFVQTTIGAFSIANTLAVQSDGKIVIGGLTEDSATAPTNQEFALARYSTAGVLDTAFGTGGIVTTDFTGNEQIDSLVIESGGQIVAAGSYFQNPDIGFHVVRYTLTGALDATFNTTGKLTVDLGAPASGAPAFPTSLAVQPDGKILIGSRSGGNAALYRYNANGATDSGFGSSGIAINTSIATGGSISAIAVLPSGKIVAAAVALSLFDTSYPVDIMRFSSAGIADSTFGTGGAASLTAAYLAPEAEPLDPTFPKFNTVYLLVPQSDGGVIAVGTRPALEDSNYPFGIVPLVTKVASDGTLDSTFTDSADPRFTTPTYFRGQVARAAAVAPDGSIVVAADVYADTTANPLTNLHFVSAPHAIGVTNYITQATSYPITIPAGGVDFTPTNGGGGGGGGGGGNPLPAGQLTAKILTRLPNKAIGGTRAAIDVMVKNAGSTRYTGPVTIEIFESTDGALGIDDKMVKTITMANVNLAAKGSRIIHVPFNYASSLATATYTILADVIETNAGTTGYVAASSRPIAIAEAIVDLQFTFVPPKPLKLKANKNNQVTLLIKNIGTVRAVGESNVALVASPTTNSEDFTITLKDGLHHINLAPNASMRVTYIVVPPASLGSSFYVSGGGGFAATSIGDSNFSNNTVLESVTVS